MNFILQATQETYHVLPDLTSFMTALGAVIGAVTALLVALPIVLSKLKGIRNEMAEITKKAATAEIKANVAETKADITSKQVAENRQVATSQFQALQAKVIDVAQSQTPPTPIQASAFIPKKDNQ